MRNRSIVSLTAALILVAGLAARADTGVTPPELVTAAHRRADGGTVHRLSLGDGAVFHETARLIVDQRLIVVPGSGTALILWKEKAGNKKVAMHAVTRDGRTIAGRVRESASRVRLKYSSFDPALRVPTAPAALAAPRGSAVLMVQFVVPPLPEMLAAIVGAGGEVVGFLPDATSIVMADSVARARIGAMPMVRWVGPMHTGYKLESRLIARMGGLGLLGNGGAGGGVDGASQKVNIQCFRRGAADQAKVAAAIVAAGGTVTATIGEGFLVQAGLTPAQTLAVARLDEVAYIDVWGAPERDMNRARAPEGSNANYLEAETGFTGEGVRGEVMDLGFRPTHSAFKSPDVVLHGPDKGINDNHGTSTLGIVFGNGAGNASGRGMAPGREQGIFASYLNLTENGGTINRYQHTAELVDSDGPYRALFQSNSWGSTSTTVYSTVSAQLDDILFIYDFVALNSMSNNGNRSVRPQAWAKNVVSVGGINHFNNSNRADDAWDFGASIGPAADGRIKPDLAHFYDSVLCPTNTNDNAYTTAFGGTSAATPITAGAFALMFQMWHEGVFTGFGLGDSPFDDRPHMSTAKALMVNTAFRYDFLGQDADLTRVHQGWGMADLRALLDRSARMFIINETDVLTPLGSVTYTLRVEPGEAMLAATLVYADPMGVPGAEHARINDLSLRVTSPDGQTFYWGNNGLLDGNSSTPGGQSNTVDTVENVLVEAPEAGDWTVEILADEVVQDSHVETPFEVDADFALVVSGALVASCYPDFTGDGTLDLFDFLAYVNAFNAGAPEADCTGDGALDLFDFLCFVNAFNAGC